MTIHVFTSAACNYLPKVRVLFNSLKRHHPELRCHLMLADSHHDRIDLAGEPFDAVLTMQDLGIDNLASWTFRHNVVELSTAVKPFAALKLLEDPECTGVIYFDPDIVVFSRLDDLIGSLSGANVLLTPHVLEPETTAHGIADHEIGALKHGIFNLGFFAVAKTGEGERFARWWADRLHDYCHIDFQAGLFTDQKWVNHAPVFFEGVEILRSPRFNVATWNSSRRPIAGSLREGLTVNGAPLGFYHFTGFDSGAHHTMAGIYARGSSAVVEMIAWYTAECERLEDRSLPGWGYAAFSDGTPVTDAHRRLYRGRPDLIAAFPDPFATGREPDFLRWYRRRWLRRMTIGSIWRRLRPKLAKIRRIARRAIGMPRRPEP